MKRRTKLGVLAVALGCTVLSGLALPGPTAEACCRRRARCWAASCVTPCQPTTPLVAESVKKNPFNCGFCIWRWNANDQVWVHRGVHSCKTGGACGNPDCSKLDPNKLNPPLKGEQDDRVLKIPCIYAQRFYAAACPYCIFEFNADSGTWDVKEFNCSAMAELPCLAVCPSPTDPGSNGDWVLSMCQ
jgi:hypothetical protein